jgi:hypothetical protein
MKMSGQQILWSFVFFCGVEMQAQVVGNAAQPASGGKAQVSVF